MLVRMLQSLYHKGQRGSFYKRTPFRTFDSCFDVVVDWFNIGSLSRSFRELESICVSLFTAKESP